MEGGAAGLDGVRAEDLGGIGGAVQEFGADGDGVDPFRRIAVFEDFAGDVGCGSKDAGV